MRSGVWHQCGDRSQKLALEEAAEGVGVGVIISPRDLTTESARTYAEQYRVADLDVALDPQFHVVGSTVGKLSSWSFNDLRDSVTSLAKFEAKDVDALARILERENRAVRASMIIAPALVYEAGRSDLVDANRRLFEAAKRAGDAIGIPTIGTAIIGRSSADTDRSFSEALSAATAVPADGWYYAVEFGTERIPSSEGDVYRAAAGLLLLASGGKQVFQAFAGPLGLLGVAAGATAVGIGHSQNLWQFTRSRWAEAERGGGGGKAPARLFSRILWGTVVYPDELPFLPEDLRSEVVEESPFATPLAYTAPFPQLSRWDGGKHLVWVVGDEIQGVLSENSPGVRLSAAIARLEGAVKAHKQIRVTLKDESATYQAPWLRALRRLQSDRKDELAVLEMLA